MYWDVSWENGRHRDWLRAGEANGDVLGYDLGEVDGNVLVLELGGVLGCDLGEVDCNVFDNVIVIQWCRVAL